MAEAASAQAGRNITSKTERTGPSKKSSKGTAKAAA
jgi:hypothetical protein